MALMMLVLMLVLVLMLMLMFVINVMATFVLFLFFLMLMLFLFMMAMLVGAVIMPVTAGGPMSMLIMRLKCLVCLVMMRVGTIMVSSSCMLITMQNIHNVKIA
jgi:hypothetical protein